MTCDAAAPTCNPHPHTQFWPVPADTDDATDNVESRPKQHIRDLGKDLKKYLHEKHRVGLTQHVQCLLPGVGQDSGHCSQGPQQSANAKPPGGPPGQSHHPPLQIWWPQHCQTTIPHEGCTHSQLSPVRATRWGTPFYEWLPAHDWDVHRTPQRWRAYTVESLAQRGQRIGCCHA
jgi:hypothetical protein